MIRCLLPLLLGATAWGADTFLAVMRKAQDRREPEERAWYFSRAVEAWTPAHSQGLLAQCLFERGAARYEIYDFAQALPDLGRALGMDPSNRRAVLLRGKILLHQALGGGADAAPLAAQAARDLADYAALEPEDLAGLLALGDAQLLAGRSGEALRTFGRAQALAPEDARPKLGGGRALMAARDWDGARASLDEADRLARGRDADVLTARAACRQTQGDGAGALADYDRALPRHEDRLADLTRSHAHPAEIAERQAAAGSAYYARGRLRESRGDAAGALADYQSGCGHGYEPCCRRLQSGVSRRPPVPEPPPAKAKPAPRPKPRKTPNPESEPGERIYGS